MYHLGEAQGGVDGDNGGVDAIVDEAPGPPDIEADAAAMLPGGNQNNGEVHDDVQQPAGAGLPDNPDHQDYGVEKDEPVGIPGVDDEIADPETLGVGEHGDETEEEEPMIEPPVGRGGGRYNLRRARGRDYDHRYAGNSFIIDEAAMTTLGTSEVLETPQMSLKAGL